MIHTLSPAIAVSLTWNPDNDITPQGTMLSVIKDGTAGAMKAAPTTLLELVLAWHAASVEALSRTPDELVVNGAHVLRDAHVVDSGGQGLVCVSV